MPFWMQLTRTAGACALLAAAGAAPLAAKAADAPRTTIHPSVARLAPGGTQQFRAIVGPGWLQPARVVENATWSVNGAPGGNARVGTIDAHGMYHAPARKPVPCEVHISASVPKSANARAWATVLVGAQQSTYRLVSSWDEPADGKKNLKDPCSIAVEPGGNLLIADAGNGKVFRFSPTGKLLSTIGSASGDVLGALAGPRALALGRGGELVVGDAHTGPPRIQVFNRDDKPIRWFGEKGVAPGLVMQIQGMAVNAAGRLYTADSDSMRVTVYERDGTLVDTWLRNGIHGGELNEPYGVAIDPNGDVFVPGYYGPCQKFTASGDLITTFAMPDPPKGPVAFTSIAGDRWGNVVMPVRDSAGLLRNAVDPEPHMVRLFKYNNNGDLVGSVKLWDDECSENAVAIDARDRLYVVFRRGERIGVATFELR